MTPQLNVFFLIPVLSIRNTQPTYKLQHMFIKKFLQKKI